LNKLETPAVEEIARPWLDMPIHFPKIKHHTTNIEVIFSDDDYFVPTENHNLFKQLTKKIIVEENMGHFSEEDEITALPGALHQLIHMRKLSRDEEL
jgi:predicted alpha/beta hydrolase family esterase